MSAADRDRGSERPDYKVYRSRPGLLSRLRAPDLTSLRDRVGRDRPGRERGDRRRVEPVPARAPRRHPTLPGRPRSPRRWLKWGLVAVGGWLLVSIAAFAVSAQIQQTKLADKAERALDGNPFLLASPQNILVLGTDTRPAGLANQAETTSERCLDAAGSGKTPPPRCQSYRADTIMVVRAGGGTLRKLSIPRDVLADIPGHGPEKINSAYAMGGARLEIRTVKKFLGIDIDHVAIVDFRGFRDFIDTLGGVEVDLDAPVCAEISGGADNGGITLDLGKGSNELDGDQALALARTRSNTCGPSGDLSRAGYQQLILAGIKNRLTSVWRLPINFLKGPWIGWNAPKAMVSDMGALAMPQLALSTVFAGDSKTRVLEPAGTSAAGNLIIPQEECLSEVRALLGSQPERTPACSPPA